MMINLDKSYYMNLNSHEISILSGSIPRFIELLLVIGPISVKSRPGSAAQDPEHVAYWGSVVIGRPAGGRLALLRPRWGGDGAPGEVGAWGHGGLGVGDLKGSLFEIPGRWEKLVLPSTS